MTAGTLHKDHFFRGKERLDYLESKLLKLAVEYGWHLAAWAVFSNHYHFVGSSREGSGTLKDFFDRTAQRDRDRVQPTGPKAEEASLAQFLGDPTDLRKVVSGAAELCASERGASRLGAGGKPIFLVISRLVREDSDSGTGQNDL